MSPPGSPILNWMVRIASLSIFMASRNGIAFTQKNIAVCRCDARSDELFHGTRPLGDANRVRSG